MRGPFVVREIGNVIFREKFVSFDVYRYSRGRYDSGHELFAECPRRDIAEFIAGRIVKGRSW
jgi:hypothetical protein